MATKLQQVTIYNKNMPDTRETVQGRIDGPWIIVNRGPHLKWGQRNYGHRVSGRRVLVKA